MKSFWKTFIGSILCGNVFVLAALPPDGWTESCPDALLLRSKEQNRPVFLFFTGSDWCPACVNMQKNVLETREFQDFARKSGLLLAWVDFPKKVPLAEAVAKQNAELMKNLPGDADEIRFPVMVLRMPDGRISGRIDGAVPLSFLTAAIAEWRNLPPLVSAVRDGNAERVRQLLASGASPDTLVSALTGQTVLMEAAKTPGSDDTIRELISAHADRNRTDADGMTALHYAARAGCLPALEILLKCKADPNALSKTGFRPLFFAVRRGDRKAVELLLRHGADPNLSVPAEKRPLLACAVYYGHMDIVQTLIRNGASVQAADEDGNTMLHYAAFLEDRGMALCFLSRNVSPAVRNKQGKLAADYTSDPSLKSLLSPKQTAPAAPKK